MPRCDCYSPTFFDRVDVYEDTSNDGDNDPSYTLSIGTVPCTIRTISGDESYKGRQLAATLTHVVETPYRDGLVPSMRLAVAGGIYDGQTLNIEAVRPIRKGASIPYLELYCKERAL